MDRIHAKLRSLRDLMSSRRDDPSQQDDKVSETPGEKSDSTYTINDDDVEDSKKACGIGDNDISSIDTFDTDEPLYYAPPEVSTVTRIRNYLYKLLTPRKESQTNAEKLQMSVMYPPGAVPMAPIAELDELTPESDKVLQMHEKKPFVESELAKSLINATPLRWFWQQKEKDENEVYQNGIYWVCYAAPGHQATVLDEYDPYTKNESLRTNIVIAIIMFAGCAVLNYYLKQKKNFKSFFESSFGMFIFFLIFGGLLVMHYAMFLIPRTRKVPMNFTCICIIIGLMGIVTSFLTAKFQTYLVMCTLLVVCVSGTVHVFLATARFDFRRFYLLFITSVAALSGTIFISGLAFVMKWFTGALQVMWLLIMGTTVSICLAMELTLMAQMKTLLLSEEDYCLGGYILFMSPVDVFVRIVQILIRLDRY